MQIINEEVSNDVSEAISTSTMPLSQAKQIYTDYKNKELALPYQIPEEHKTERIVLGSLQRWGQSLEVIPEGIGILGGEILMLDGKIFKDTPLGILSDTKMKLGEKLINAANSSLEEKRKRQAQELLPMTEEESNSVLAKSISTVTDYGSQILLALATGGTAALAAMGARMAGETAIQGLEQYKIEHPEDKELKGFLTTGNLSKEVLLNAGKTAINLYVEKAIGVPKQVSQFKKALKTPSVGALGVAKAATKGYAMGFGEEWATETIQGISDTTFDAFLGRYKDLPELADAYKESIIDAVYSGVFGGGFGASGHVLARGKAIGNVKEMMSNVVPEADLDRVATAIVDNHIASTKQMIGTQIQLSTELRDKHGEIFNAMNVAAKNAMMESGVVNTMTEDEIAQHSTELATMFADQVLAEANKRNVPIMDVIQGQDIVYDPETKELRLAPQTEEIKARKAMVQYQDVAERINEIDAEEQANGVPEYTAPTININGVERQTTNSEGNPIAKSEKSLRYFYDWFGDSKVVDLQDRPIVVYHGTDHIFDEFKMYSPGYDFDFPAAAYFSSKKRLAKGYSRYKDIVMPVYLKMEHPYINSAEGQTFNNFYDEMASDMRYALEHDYDGYIVREIKDSADQKSKITADTYVVFDPNQIKSTSNRGTYSLTEDNIYYQWEDIGNKTKYTKSEYDLKKMMQTFPPRGELRLMFDKEKGYWFAADSMELVHSDILPQAFKMGLYPEFRTEHEARQYFNDKTYADDGSLVRFIAFGYENNNYMDRIDQMADDYSRAYIIDNGNGNGVVLFARYESDLDDANISYLGENAKLYDVVNKRFLENGVFNQEGEDTKDLVVYHNISKESLEKAMKLGGLPVPSLAITRKDIPFGRFGEISLVGNKEIIDPRNYKNEVYNRDVWSATFPQTEYRKPKDSSIKKFKNKYGKFFDKAGDTSALSSFVYSLTFSPARAENEIANSLGMKLAYIETELGKDVEIPKKDFGESILKENRIDKQFVEDVKDVDGDSKKIRQEVTKAYLKMLDRKDYSEFGKYAEKMKNIEKTGDGVFDKEDGLMYFNRADTLLYAAKNYVREQGKSVIDDTALRRKIDDMIKDKQAYREWSRNTLEYELLGEPKIEVGRSLKEMTLQNIVDAMTMGETKNAQDSFVYGTGKVIAAGAKKLESIADIKQESGKFVSEEEEKAIHEKLTEDITSFSSRILKLANISFDFNAMSAAHAALGHIATLKNPTIDSLQKALNKEMGEKRVYPRYILEEGVRIAEEVKGLARHYFEAKPQRAVMLNEFSGAIVPTKTEYDSIAKQLEDTGLKVVRSDNQVEAAQQFKDVFFQDQEQRGRRPKGMFDANSKVIKLFEKADASTLDHELAHFWLDNMWTYANSGAASETYKAQFDAVKSFLGVDATQSYLTYAQHEKFASAYEKYIHRGIIPNSMMGNVFDNYERFIRNVYDSINDIRYSTKKGERAFKLTPEIIKFFDSMLTGGVDVTSLNAEMVTEERNEEAQKADDTTMKDAKEVVREMPNRAVPVAEDIKPVESTGETKESRLFERLKGLAGSVESVGYNVANIQENREKARKMWAENPDRARAILNGTEMADDVLRQTLYTEQQKIALQVGDTTTYLNSLRKQTAEATRMGQELSALRGVVEDITDPSYWIRSAELEALKNLAKKQTKNLENALGNSPLIELTSRLDQEIKSLQKAVASKATNEEKLAMLKEGAERIAEKYQGLDQPDTVFNQVDWDNEEYANDYIENKVKEKLGIALSTEKAKAFIQTARELDALSRTRDAIGLPSDAFFAKKDELERMRNSHTPTSRTKVLISTIGRSNMLTAPATSVLNVVSNTQNFALENIIRKVNNLFSGHTNDNLVSQDLIDKYRARTWDIFWKTGYDVSMMSSLLDERLYKGESVTHSEGDGAIRAVGRFAEKYVFSRLISSPDIYFRSYLGFPNFVGNEATEIAYKEGLTGKKAKARADQLFKDAIKIEPETEQGKMIREKARLDSLILTFQQDTKMAQMLTGIRTKINEGLGDIGIGDILSPFIKTPANIISMGFDASVGPFASPVNLIGAINDIRHGNIKSARVLQAVRQTTTATLAYTVLGLLVSMCIDDDDYIPDYAQLTQAQRNAVRAMGGSFGSVRIGNEWISTDFFGTLEMPLVVFLNTRRTGNVLKGLASGVGSKFLDAPVLKDILGSSDAIKDFATDKNDIISAIGENVSNAAISRLTPNAMNTISRLIDNKDRKANNVLDKLVARIPFARETLDERLNVATGLPQELGRINTLLLGSRGKLQETAPLAVELGRLAGVGQAANISDPTKAGDLKLLPDAEKKIAQNLFAIEYSRRAGKLVSTSTYARMTDEAKKEALNKVKKEVVDAIKKKYKTKLAALKKKK